MSSGRRGAQISLSPRGSEQRFLPSRYQACSCVRRAIRCSIVKPGRHFAEQQGARRPRHCELNQQHQALVSDPRLPLALRSMRWPSRCRPAYRNSWTSTARRQDAGTYGCHRPTARLPATACSPADSRTGRPVHPALPKTGPSQRGQGGIALKAKEIDRADGADHRLKQRGMFDDTLLCGCEFGRTPMSQGAWAAITTTRR